MDKLKTSTKNYIALHETGHLIFGISELLKKGLDEYTIKKGTVLVFKEDNPEGTEHGSFVVFNKDNRRNFSELTYLSGSICALYYLDLINESILNMRRNDIVKLLITVGGEDDVDRGRLRQLNDEEIHKLIRHVFDFTSKNTYIITKIASDALRIGRVCGNGLNCIIQTLKQKN